MQDFPSFTVLFFCDKCDCLWSGSLFFKSFIRRKHWAQKLFSVLFLCDIVFNSFLFYMRFMFFDLFNRLVLCRFDLSVCTARDLQHNF